MISEVIWSLRSLWYTLLVVQQLLKLWFLATKNRRIYQKLIQMAISVQYAAAESWPRLLCALCMVVMCVCVLQRCCYCIEREWMGCEVWVLFLFWSVLFRDGNGIHILPLAHKRVKCCHILRWLAWWGEVWHQLLVLAVFHSTNSNDHDCGMR